MDPFVFRTRHPLSRRAHLLRFRPSLSTAEDRIAAGDLLWTGLFADPMESSFPDDPTALTRLVPEEMSTPQASLPIEDVPVPILRGSAPASIRPTETNVFGPTLRLPSLDADWAFTSAEFGLKRAVNNVNASNHNVTFGSAVSTSNRTPNSISANTNLRLDDSTSQVQELANEPVATIAGSTSSPFEKTDHSETTPTVTSVSTKDDSLATHHYSSDGRDIGMTISPTRVAVGGVNADALGLTFVRQLTPDVAVYEGLGAGTVAGRSTLAATPGVTLVAPVFVIGESNSEAVLLDEVIVALAPGQSADEFFNGDARFSSFRPLAGTPDQFVATVAAGPGEAALAVVNDLARDNRLAWAAPNFFQDWKKLYTPNDPRFANLWHLHNTGQGGGLVDADPDLPEAWDVNQGGSAAITVAIVDDGVPTDHPDILNWVNAGEIAGNGLDDDGNGWVDDRNGWNFVDNNANAAPQSSGDMHGTSVAGVAAARGDNGVGVTGAAYKSPLMSVRIFNGSTATTDANIASSLYYAAGRTLNGTGTWKAADIVNNSWGGGGSSAAINAALSWGTTQGRQGKGSTYFFATGNGGGGSVLQPAGQSLSIPGVVGIGAVGNTGTRSAYSQYGSGLDLVAPSSGGTLRIDTTDRVGSAGYDASDYNPSFGGTSSATPLASGIAALVLAQADAKGVPLTAPQLRRYLLNATDLAGGVSYDPTTGRHVEYGTGRLNAFTAVSGIGKAEISIISPTSDLTSGSSVAEIGSAFVGQSKDLTFRIRNQGTSPLSVGSLSVASGPFTVVTAPGATTLNLGESTTFTLRFTPSAVGTVDRTVTLTNGDADEGTFTFAARGTGVAPNVSGTTFEDWNGDGTIAANDPVVGGIFVFADVNNNGVFDTSEPSTTSDAAGLYSLVSLPNGTYPIRSQSPAGWTGTVPGGGLTVTIGNSSDTNPNRNFGQAKNNRFYGNVWDDKNGNGVRDSGELPVAGRTVYVDANANGVMDGSTQSFSNTTPIPISNVNTKYYSDISVSGIALPLNDVNVTVNFTHPWAADLDVFLVSPGGTRVELFTDVGGGGDNFVNTVLDDQAATLIADGAAPFTGSFRPEGNLAVLNGLSGTAVNGTWRLEVTDDGNGDVGQLNSWSLHLGTAEPSTSSNSLGNVSFDLAAGATNVRLIPVAGFRYTSPTDGKYAVTAAGSPLFDRSFGVMADTTAPTIASTKVDVGTDQRSRVSSVALTFNELVTFSGTPTSAVTVTKAGGGTVGASATVDNSGPATILNITFTDTTEFGSLLDGDYTIALNGAMIRDLAQNVMTGTPTTSFHRLYGDVNGDRSVNGVDLGIFRSTFGSSASDGNYRIELDHNADGSINGVDLGQIRNRFGQTLP